MIKWLFGNSGAGKTTLAKEMLNYKTVHLDGDDVREVWTDLKLDYASRYEQNMRIARLAKIIESQGFDVIVSSICPYRELRKEVQKLTQCEFIYLSGGLEGSEYPFEEPEGEI